MKLKNFLRSQKLKDNKIIINNEIEYSILTEIKDAIVNNKEISFSNEYKQYKHSLMKCDTLYQLYNVLQSLPLETIVSTEYNNDFQVEHIEIY